MKRVLLLLCLCPLMTLAQQKFTINGSLKVIASPTKAFLYYAVNGRNKIDSTAINGGLFTFRGTLSDVTQAHIKIKRSPGYKAGTRNMPSDILDFYLEPGTIAITSKNDSVRNAVIKGSVINDDVAKCKATADQIQLRAQQIVAQYKSGTPEQLKDTAYLEGFNKQLKVLDQDIRNINSNFMRSNRDSYYSLILFKSTVNVEANPDNAAKEFAAFSARLKSTELGKRLLKSINGASALALGQKAMDFTQNDVNGKPVRLSDFKGKYVLIDFWASWCGPCRQENPNVLRAYNKYKDQNFTVLGVSLDNPGQKEAWLQAIKEDGLSWTQVSDLKGGNNEVAEMYQVKSIPTNFLVGPDGKILAKNLRGADLENKILELLDKTKKK